ncbi:MAG: GTP cyclohydrolase MptA [Thermoplasmatota archaeon]
MTLPDVQNHRAPHSFKLTRVGVTGVKKPIHVKRAGRASALVGTFDAFVDLPAEQRGIHMSRNVEAINQTIDALVRADTVGLEDLALAIAKELLARHDYATEVEAAVSADYFRERRTPVNGAASLERYTLEASASARRGGVTRKTIGVVVTGMTACPCAMESTRKILAERGLDVAGFPTVTHNQRNHVTLAIETDERATVEADDLIDIAEESLSAPTFELLKRGDEAALVLAAHDNPRFVEDVVREALARVAKRYAHLADDTIVLVRSVAEESIHKHNAVAERATTLAELR